MSAQSPTLEMDLPTNLAAPMLLPADNLLARLGQSVMRTVRQTAWRLLDLETEFEVLD